MSLSDRIGNSALTTISELVVGFISVEEMSLLSKMGKSDNIAGLNKIRSMENYLDAILCHESICHSYTNAMRCIVQFLLENNDVSSWSVYKSSLPISHIREILSMFKVCGI